jgi:hypothetical protein
VTEDYPRFTPEEAVAVAAVAAFRAETEGCWVAVCDCGQTCGFGLFEPTPDDAKYVACPRCRCTGATGGVRWMRQEPEAEAS